MALAIVQHNAAVHGSQVPGSITLAAAPTAGNLLIAFIGCNLGFASFTIGTGWKLFDASLANGASPNCSMLALYRYAVGGDTATLPAFCTAGSTYWTHVVYEISGVSGTWTSDMLMSVPTNDSATAPTSDIPAFPMFASGIALSAFSRYNGNANPTISGSWTRDEAANNNGNFGSLGGASRTISNGDTLDGAWSGGGTSSPLGSITAVLVAARPAANKPVVRQTGFATNNTFPGAFTIPWTPKQGCLQIVYLLWANGLSGSPTFNTSDWTIFKEIKNGSNDQIVGLYRYVGASETVLKAICTAGSASYWCYVFELDNVTGTFATDHVSSNGARQSSGASLTTTSDATTKPDQLGLLAYGNYSASTLATTTGFAGYMQTSKNGGAYGAAFVAFKWFSAAGSTVQGVITPGDSTTAQSYIQDIFFQGTSSTETATGVMSFGSLAFAGVSIHKETAVGALAFQGISFVGVGHDYLPGGTGVLSFGGLAFSGSAEQSDPATGALNFGQFAFQGRSVHIVTAMGVMSFGGIAIRGFALDPGARGSGLRQFWTH